MVMEENGNEEWRFTGYYDSPYVNNKNAYWNLLRKLGQDQRHPWFVSGDFNEIMYSFEKSGGLPRDERQMEAFRETLEECQLEDLGYTWVWFTWERGNLPETNIKERLDRGVANDKWRNLFPTGNIHHLTHSISDHCPLLLNTKSGNT
ncbi:hypothetical protein Gotur_021851 [Gossypium turneri]